MDIETNQLSEKIEMNSTYPILRNDEVKFFDPITANLVKDTGRELIRQVLDFN